ncbi:uncharacterized protein [Physcomitrium patens]|uniref:Uncharacterized protein n=1 Tax=Physcomitrium patens TaxID=3218 RepID=A0A2K1L1X7_PHYPA|nr:uncharacterized protein LOC112273299 [Physcomitrium patens]PNR60016.1 hypothetical protein PHYPA_002808 [Physcomitrium patens]|eukprot:XP_024357678.1 uncharacterized protein LOC112273299 [Physcomitrella patens]
MDSKRSTTRSRRASLLPVSPIKQALMASVMAAAKPNGKKSTRKPLADKTNSSRVAGPTPAKSGKKAAVVQEKKGVCTPRRKVQSPEQPATPVMRGEDVLRSVVHRNLAMIQTPANGDPDTPQFRVSRLSLCSDVPEPVATAELSTLSEQNGLCDGRQADALSETSPYCEVTSISESPSPGVDQNCPMIKDVGEVAPDLLDLSLNNPRIPPTTDFKWRRRESAKVQEVEESFNHGESEDDLFEQELEQVECDEICYGISRIRVAEGLPEFQGRHTRFNYNTDDEVDIEVVDGMRLRGLPTPKGKHLRFSADEQGASP